MPQTSDSPITVSQLNRRVKDLLEQHFPMVWIEGEISNISRPASGHWYFSLKDSKAQVSCAMFRSRNLSVKWRPTIGDHVVLRARVSLYEGRGDYQLIVEHMAQAGLGALQQQFELLKARLQQEGLFDSARKRTLPASVEHLAVVTSPSGAAIRDVLSVLQRRYPQMVVTIVPTAVQGKEAPAELIAGLEKAAANTCFDVILLCRGGGSIEDLWAFNDERLARAIAQCKTPVVSAVGHEIDFTISDFVADVRAATPSAAAELLSPDQEELRRQLHHHQHRLQALTRRLLTDRSQEVRFLGKRLRHPQATIEQWQQRFDHNHLRLQRAFETCFHRKASTLHDAVQALSALSPRFRINAEGEHFSQLSQRLYTAVLRNISRKQERAERWSEALDLVSPLATVKRGYSIVRDKNGGILRSVSSIRKGQMLSTTLSDGTVTSEVINISDSHDL